MAAKHTTTTTPATASGTTILASTALNLSETETHKDMERQMTDGSQLPNKWQSQLSNDAQIAKRRTQLSNDTEMATTGPRWKGKHRLHRQMRV